MLMRRRDYAWTTQCGCKRWVTLTLVLFSGTSHSIHGQQVNSPQLKRPVASAPADQDEVDDDQLIPIPFNDGWDEEAIPPGDGRPPARRVVLSVSVEHWVFGQEGSHGTALLKAFLQQKMAAIQREYTELNAANLEKLELAGKGDIKRFHDQVAVLKARYPQNTIDQEQLHLVLAEVQTLRQRLHSDQFFGDQSILTKTLRLIVARKNATSKAPLKSIEP